MKIALASQNRRTLTAHAGKCCHFFVHDSATPGSLQTVLLSPAQSLRQWDGRGGHPLAGVDVVIGATVGQGVVEKLARLGVRALATPERDLQRVIAGLADGSLPLTEARDEPDARSRPGECCPPAAASPLKNLLLSGAGGPWSNKN